MVQHPTYKDLEKRIHYLEKKLHQLHEESALNGSEERCCILSDAAREGLFILENGYCIEANQSGCEMFGYSYEEIIGIDASSVFVKADQPLVRERIKNAWPEVYEVQGVRKNGAVFIAEIKGSTIDFHGRKIRVTSVFDISDRKNAELKLIESESKYREVVENAADGILIGNLEGNIVEVNQGFLSMTGYDRDEVLNRNIIELFDPECLREKPLRFDLLNKGESVIIERDIVDKKGNNIPIEMNSKRPHSDYYLAIIRDLRERRQAQSDLHSINKKLSLAKEKAEESDRLKSAFLANMSHEIRTPLNAVIGFADLLRGKSNYDDEWRSYLEIIINSGEQLLYIINDVLTISRIETGRLQIKQNKVDLSFVLNDLYLLFQPMASDTHNQIVVSIPENISDHLIMGDESKLRQILTNLINNALKFTRYGVITIGYFMEDKGVHFFVKDTGIGIPDESIETVFDRFVQVDHANTYNQSGTGLGLAICQKLVDLMNGKIWVESKSGEGSVFHFVLPV